MERGEQIRTKKRYAKVTAKRLKVAKRIHARRLRRLTKQIELPNPQYNRYNGFVD